MRAVYLDLISTLIVFSLSLSLSFSLLFERMNRMLGWLHSDAFNSCLNLFSKNDAIPAC